MRRHRLVRAAVLTLLTGVALLLGTAPAWAHSRLESSDPAAGASLATAPGKVSLTFNEVVQPGFTTITVIGPDGEDYHTGTPVEVDDTVSTGVLPLGPAGGYRIGYRVVSADGHPVTGSVAFTLTAAGPGHGTVPAAESTAVPGAAAASAAAGGGGGAPVWLWVVGAVVVLGAGVAVALRLGRA